MGIRINGEKVEGQEVEKNREVGSVGSSTGVDGYGDKEKHSSGDGQSKSALSLIGLTSALVNQMNQSEDKDNFASGVRIFRPPLPDPDSVTAHCEHYTRDINSSLIRKPIPRSARSIYASLNKNHDFVTKKSRQVDIFNSGWDIGPPSSEVWRVCTAYKRKADKIRPGVNMIQGSLTLTAEEPGDCTEILPGMHNHLEDWWGLVEERGLSTDGYVHRIKDTMYTKDDERKFGIRWTDIICKPGDVRITSPLLPHGAHGPCKKVRRTMLPWYVAIQEDHEHLEVDEAGTWSQLSAAHRDLVPGPSSPSGHSNRYASVPYRFPTAIQLQGLGAISDALVGRIRWDNPMVIEELDTLFGPEEKKAQDFINNWRLKATRIALDAIVKTYQIEKKAFGNKSCWHCVHNNIDPASVRPSPPPENLVEEEDHGDHY
ncbi:hypothetical protein CIHG_01655 [Coccidioides immitis H538.4]|uniref:Uncharacterized protein n=1 Tax=Coccidioides immitis H538.4 TaxID=396776 RepID=A0A0J8RGV2_COCIT|nr:hypothetical protein CIHG_01655 [Coccidioides immitis H538.4]